MADPNLSDEVLKRLTDIQRVGQFLFQNEAERMALKHGVDDPRTLRLVEAAEGASAMLEALEIAREGKFDPVTVEKDGALFYGRVAADDLRGVAELEVALEDANGRVVRSAGTATTDASGKYMLRIAPAVAEKLAGKEFTLTARNAKGTVLFRTEQPIMLELNKAVNTDAEIKLRSAAGKTPPKPKPTEPPTEPPREVVPFTVRGTVVGAEGKPVSGVLVRVFDKDVKYDDLLGAELTNRKGEFLVTYRQQDFAEGETAADLYFTVSDASGKMLHSSADKVMFNAARDATVEIKLE